MPFEPQRPNYPGEMPSARGLNQIQDAIRTTGRFTGDSRTGIRQNAAGLAVFDQSEQPFYAKITSGTNPYAWSEVFESTGGFVAYPEGRAGLAIAYGSGGYNWPAYEINGATGVSAGTYGRFLKAADGDYYWFEQIAGGGGGSSLIVTDGTTSVTSVTEIDFTSRATVSNLGGGVAGVALAGVTVQATSGSLGSPGSGTVCSLTFSVGGLVIIVGNTTGTVGYTNPGGVGVDLGIYLHSPLTLLAVQSSLILATTPSNAFASVTWIGTVTAGQQIDLLVSPQAGGVTGTWTLRSILI